MKKLLILLIFLVSVEGFAQEEKSKLILKTTPSYIFDFDNTFTLGAEYRVRQYVSLQGEVGYGNTNQNLLIGAFRDNFSDQNDYRNFNVFRGKAEVRFYSRKNKKTFPQGYYNAVEVFYKYIGKESFQRVGRDAINFVPEYFEQVLVRKSRQVYGSHFKIGNQFYIFDGDPKKRKRWLCDVYLGVGFRNIDNQMSYDTKRESDQITGTNRGFGKIFNDNGKQLIVSGTLGFKLGYLI